MDASASDEPRTQQDPDPTDSSTMEGSAAEATPAPPTPADTAGGVEPAATPPADVPDGAPAQAASPAPDAPEGAGVASTDGGAAGVAEAAAPAAEGSQAEGEQAAAGGAETGDGAADGEKAKRKRKRKRKRKAGAAEGEGAEGEGKKRESAAPFAHLFAAGSPKRHAFAVGEVVAGRVQRVEDGGIVVDLFGKALAVADEFEPRDVPPMPEPAPAETSVAGGQSAPAVEGDAPAQAAADGETTPTVAAGEQLDVEAASPSLDSAAAPAVAEPSADIAVASADAGALPDAVEAAPLPTGAAEPADASAPYVAVQPNTAEASPEAVVEPEVAAATDATAATSATLDPSAEPASADEAGEADEAAGAKGPLPPVPVVPEALGRPEPVTLGGIFKGRVGAVAESGHIVLVNRIIDRPVAKAAVRGYRDQRRRVEGLVFGFNRGGFDVLVDGIRAFCPASAMSLGEIPEPETHVGRKYEFLLPSSKGGKDIVVSRRSILERQARKRAKELVRSLEPGQRFKGRVTSVRDFGLFVDIGGVEGLVHQSEISHAFGVKPADSASAGDEVEVQVLRVGDSGKKKKEEGGKKERRDRVTRVSLSIKALLPDPWDEHGEAVAEGRVCEGKVTRTTEFGAFIELAPSIEGLLHISELGRELAHANQAVTEGDTLHVIVERADRKARRISLSRLTGAELEDFQAGRLDPAAAPKNLRPGARLTVRVDKADNRGVVVRVAGAIGRRARGFIPASETGTERGSDLRKRFPSGQEVEVKVIGQDRDGGLKCSIKALQVDEERRAVKDYRREASKQGFGTFGDLLKAKLGQ